MSAPASRATQPAEVEYRIALVLYGGVSLAVYMGGVVAEFYRLVQASRVKGSIASQSPFRPLLDALGATAKIDVIAGTSAGGINGILLARALATDAPIDFLVDVWREKGDIARLADWQGKAPNTLLNGDWFWREMEAAIDHIGPQPGEPLVDVLDLFVTATDYAGRTWRRHDALGAAVEGRRHAHLSHLKVRRPFTLAGSQPLGYSHNDLASDAPKEDKKIRRRLAKLCRTTASLPAIFDAVPFTRSEAYPGDPAGPDAYMMDGGLLQNRPFAPVIRTILNRAADRPVERLLFYIEPKLHDQHGKEKPNGPPHAVDAARSVLSIPSYEPIDDHLAELERHQREVTRFKRTTADLEERIRAYGESSLTEDTHTTAYRLLREQELRAYLEARQAPLPQGAQVPLECDLPYEQRRLYYLIEQVDRLAAGLPTSLAGRRSLSAAIYHQAGRVWRMSEELRQLAWQWQHEQHQTPTAAHRCLATRLTDWRQVADTEILAALSEIVRLVQGAGLNPSDAQHLLHIWRHYDLRDLLILPLEVGSSLGERDPIAWVRISPYDADTLLRGATGEEVTPQRRREYGDRKLAGDQLESFGGFLSWRWRVNDYMWGRLDAVDQIIRSLTHQAEQSGRYTSAELVTIRQVADDCRQQAVREILATHLPQNELERLVDQPEPVSTAAAETAASQIATQGATALAPSPAQAVSAVPWQRICQFLLHEYQVGAERVTDLQRRVLLYTVLDLAYNTQRVLVGITRQSGTFTLLRAPLALAGTGIGIVRWLARLILRRPAVGQEDRRRRR